MFGLKFWLEMFKITSVSGAPPQTPLGELTTLPQTLSREGLLAFGNRSFAPSALNPPLAPPNKNPRPISPPKHKILEPPLVGILHPGVESASETGYGKIGENAKKSHKNDLSYEERLIRCRLTTLKKRRSRGDLIGAYKIITGKESIQWERFFELPPSKGTRGHRYKLFKKRKGTIGQKFFSARVVDLWNELDDSTVSVDNVTAFKRKLGKLGY